MKTIAAGLMVVALLSGACSSSNTPAPQGTTSSSNSPGSSETPVAAESNPPGDIPDNQAFVTYTAAGGFSFKYPEGWARTGTSTSVDFSDKLNGINASWMSSSTPPSEQRARSQDIPRLQQQERAFESKGITTSGLPTGASVLITYRANSAPNDVTGKQYRLDVLLYEYYRAGKEVWLRLSSPVGADNVDPWNIVSGSVRWG